MASPFFLLLMSFKSSESSEMQISRFHGPLFRVFDFLALGYLRDDSFAAKSRLRNPFEQNARMGHTWLNVGSGYGVLEGRDLDL